VRFPRALQSGPAPAVSLTIGMLDDVSDTTIIVGALEVDGHRNYIPPETAHWTQR